MEKGISISEYRFHDNCEYDTKTVDMIACSTQETQGNHMISSFSVPETGSCDLGSETDIGVSPQLLQT
jgi:hypothetical protein